MHDGSQLTWGSVHRIKLQSKFLLRISWEGAPLDINDNPVSASSELGSTLVPLAEHQRNMAGFQNPHGTNRC